MLLYEADGSVFTIGLWQENVGGWVGACVRHLQWTHVALLATPFLAHDLQHLRSERVLVCVCVCIRRGEDFARGTTMLNLKGETKPDR